MFVANTNLLSSLPIIATSPPAVVQVLDLAPASEDQQLEENSPVVAPAVVHQQPEANPGDDVLESTSTADSDTVTSNSAFSNAAESSDVDASFAALPDAVASTYDAFSDAVPSTSKLPDPEVSASTSEKIQPIEVYSLPSLDPCTVWKPTAVEQASLWAPGKYKPRGPLSHTMPIYSIRDNQVPSSANASMLPLIDEARALAIYDRSSSPEVPRTSRHGNEITDALKKFLAEASVGRYYMTFGSRESHTSSELFDYDEADEEFISYRKAETKFDLRNYMNDVQTELTPFVRSETIAWMIEQQVKLNLLPDTLFLAVKIVDLFLSKNFVSKRKLQLIGAAALFIATKNEEAHTPRQSDYLDLTAEKYTSADMLDIELKLLVNTGLSLRLPVSYKFLKRYITVTGLGSNTMVLGRLILEYNLLEHNVMLNYLDSLVAAGAVLLAAKMHRQVVDVAALAAYSGYSVADLKVMAKKLTVRWIGRNTSNHVMTQRYLQRFSRLGTGLV